MYGVITGVLKESILISSASKCRWSINSWDSSLGNELEIGFVLYGALCCINEHFSNQKTWTKAIQQIKHWGCENICLKFGKNISGKKEN